MKSKSIPYYKLLFLSLAFDFICFKKCILFSLFLLKEIQFFCIIIVSINKMILINRKAIMEILVSRLFKIYFFFRVKNFS